MEEAQAGGGLGHYTGKQKAAMLLIGLGTEGASKIFKHLGDAEIEQVVNIMSEMREVPSEMSEKVMAEAFSATVDGTTGGAGGVNFTKKVLQRALGYNRAKDLLNKIDLKEASFDSFNNVNVEQLTNVLSNEHPQTVALILAHFEPAQSAEVLAGLPEEMQSDVTLRIAKFDQADPTVIFQINQVLRKLVSSNRQDLKDMGGTEAVASILNLVDRGVEKSIMSKMQDGDKELADEIKNLMFMFEDVVLVDDKSMQRVLKEVDMSVLTIALKGASDEVADKFYNNLSKRAVEMIKEELEYMGPVKLKVVEESQQQVISIVRSLEDQGEIIITGRGGVEDEIIV
jgi:flagellar motor switch protein FliG